MKITIEAETEDERKDYPKPLVTEKVAMFALAAWARHPAGIFLPIHHYRTSSDPSDLIGQLYTVIEKMRYGRS